MARQIGLIKFRGNLDGLSGYKSKTKQTKSKEALIRTAGGVDGERIKTSPAFVRTRENMSEFGRAGSLAKQIRLSHSQNFQRSRNPLLASQLTKAVRDLIALDNVNVRGERTLTSSNYPALKGLKINQLVNLDSILNFPIAGSFVSPNYNLDIPAFTPISDVNADPASDVMHISLVASAIDPATATVTAGGSADSGVIDVSQGSPTAAQTLSVDLSGANAGDLVVVSVAVYFAQNVNGVDYPLKNDSYIPIAIFDGLAFA